MAKIVIEGKEHNCSKRVKEEIEWLDIRIYTSKKIAKIIEDKREEITDFVSKKESEIQELLNELQNL